MSPKVQQRCRSSSYTLSPRSQGRGIPSLDRHTNERPSDAGSLGVQNSSQRVRIESNRPTDTPTPLMQTLGSQEHCEVRLHECQLYLLNRLANLFWASGLEV